ncbi:MAG TPA: sugar transferase [Terracidiphilus sp.]|nr:sugar transferase [Terracidiphilus sp.]
MRYLAALFDITALAASLLITLVVFSFPRGMTFAGFVAMRIGLGNCLLFAFLLFVWHAVFIACGLYLSQRLTTLRMQSLEIVKASALAAFLLLAMGLSFHFRVVTLRFAGLFWVSTAAIMIAGRFAARGILLALRRRGINTRHILIVGTNQRAIDFGRRLLMNPQLGYHLVGFVDDDWDGTEHFQTTGHVRCCTFPELRGFLRTSVVDEAAIYLPLRSYYEHAAELVALCEEHGIAIRFDPRLFNSRRRRHHGEDLEESAPALSPVGPYDTFPALIKRSLDIGISSVLLLLLSPLFSLVGILIKLTSRGPVFFRQTRMGLNKRTFTMYKFRTMVENAEQLQDRLLPMNEMSGPAFKIRSDPRITPLGRILRKTSIDELPQLFNVLTGDMSLVGPRAMSLRDYQLFEVDWQRRRFCVKPGITCLWQVRGRNSIPFEQWMELDMQYIDTWSIWLDLKILMQTVPAVLRGTGAG